MKTLKQLILNAGTVNAPPLLFTGGPVLTNPVAGAEEYDGTQFFKTINTTNGRAQDSTFHIFRLGANGGAIGPTIADVFGANSAIPTILNSVYRIRWYLYFLKTTAGTLTFTLTNTAAYTNLVANYKLSAIGGIGANASPTLGAIVGQTAAASALPVSGSLTTAVNHYAEIEALAEIGTAGNVRLRATQSAGTITPLRGSYFTVERIANQNTGAFAA